MHGLFKCTVLPHSMAIQELGLLHSLEAVDISDPCEQVRIFIGLYDPVSKATQHCSIGQVVISPPGLKGVT